MSVLHPIYNSLTLSPCFLTTDYSSVIGSYVLSMNNFDLKDSACFVFKLLTYSLLSFYGILVDFSPKVSPLANTEFLQLFYS